MVTGTSYTVTDGLGSCASPASASFSNAAQLPSPVATITGSLNYCVGGNTTLTANGGTGFVWNDAGNSTTASITATAGTYTVTVSDVSSCTATASAVVTETAAPVVSISGSLTYCTGGNTTLTASGGTGFVWNDAGNSTTASITVTQGTYTVTGSDAGCTATATATVTENPVPAAAISGSLTYCTGGSTTLTASGGTGFVWNDAGNSTTASITATAGTYTVTVSDAGSCTATASVTVTANGALAISASSIDATCGNNNGSATVAVNAGNATGYVWSNSDTTAVISNLAAGVYNVTVNDASGCSATASVTVSSSNISPVAIAANQSIFCNTDSARICAPSGYTSYLWNTGSVDSCIVTKLAGNYYVTVTDNNGCTVASNTQAISVYPQPPVSISLSGDTLIAYNSVTYQWLLNGSPISGADSGLYVASQSGSYQVIVSDTNGCTAKSLAVDITVTGLNNLSGNYEIRVFPNPASSSITVSVPEALIGSTLTLTDITGRQLATVLLTTANRELSTDDFANGVYFATIRKDGGVYSKKLMIQH
jgi:hypothetical protein